MSLCSLTALLYVYVLLTALLYVSTLLPALLYVYVLLQHRNTMNEFMGLIKGMYEAKQGGFLPGGLCL
jgi:hypothetical protein